MKRKRHLGSILLSFAAAAVCLLLIAGCGKTTTVKLEELDTRPVSSTSDILPTDAEIQVPATEETEAFEPSKTKPDRNEQTEPSIEDTEPAIEEKEPVAEETESVTEETEPVVDETESQIVSQSEETDEREPTARIYILNKSSKKIHYPSCSSVRKMSKKNRLEFEGTMKELKEMGYVPCGGCRPK